MMRSLARGTVAVLVAAALIVLAFTSPAHALIHKAIGQTSVATANCAEGCTLAMRIKKGETVVKDNVQSGVPWTWLDAWGTGTFAIECKCGDSDWHVIETYEVVDYDLPIVSVINSEDSPISVWLPENFADTRPELRVWTYPHPEEYCSPWIWANATLWFPKTFAWNYSEANLSSQLGTRLVSVQAMLNSQQYGYGERQVTMAEEMTVTGLGGAPGTWEPGGLLTPVLQTVTDNSPKHFEFSTTVTTTVHETETGKRTFSVSGAENNTIPATMTAEVYYGVYDVQRTGGGTVDSHAMLLLRQKVGYDVQDSRTLTNPCALTLDVPANRQLTVFLGPEGDQRSGTYDYYADYDINGAAESEEEGTYDAVRVTAVYLDYTVSEFLP